MAAMFGYLRMTNMLLSAGATPNWASMAMTGDIEGAREILTTNPDYVNKRNMVN